MNEPKQKRRLSELIRAGAALRPQGILFMFGPALNGDSGSCALGAAYEALTGLTCCFTDSRHASEVLMEEYPILHREVDHPAIRIRSRVASVITHLNDVCRITREEIADWVEAIEAEEACNAIQAKPETVTA